MTGRPEGTAWATLVWPLLAACVASASCRPAADIQPGDIRSYVAPPARSSAGSAAAGPAMPAPSMPAAGASDGGRPTIAYDLPEGWTDLGASGMRLATLRIGGDTAGNGEVTIIPASGTLEGNATRWQEQLTPAGAPEAVSRAIAAAERVTVNGAESTILTLVDDAEEPTQAILAAMIPLDSSVSLFVKFKGPIDTARTLQQPFSEFVRSIRWK